MANDSFQPWMHFLGKWGTSQEGHPLIYHLIDSAAVAQVLWQQALTEGARKQFTRWMNLSEEECGRVLAFWTSLHDLGKATNSFQGKTPAKAVLTSLGFHFQNLQKPYIRHHSILSQVILCDFQKDISISPLRMFNLFRYAIGGHHGSFHVHDDRSLGTMKILENNLGGEEWTQAHREIVTILKNLFDPPAVKPLMLSQTDQNAFFNLLTGFFVISDWLSSQDDPFVYHPIKISPLEYLQEITEKKLAFTAVNQAGWLGWKPDGSCPSFQKLFSTYTPLPLQQKIFDEAARLSTPFLMIVEAPTGCGKTEAALMAADRAIQNGRYKGCYIAMPTQATSNQIFNRVKEFLLKRYPTQNINLQLVHGNAILNKEFQNLRLDAIHDEDVNEQNDEGSVNAQEWFLPRKRSLLASFGVGTVDQTFYSILRARYSILRLFGLYGKVIIFDEIHAYDSYMLKIFTQLLGWLRAVGSSVILLSATLPEKTRLELLQAFTKNQNIESKSSSYPRMSINDCHTIRTVSLGEFKDRKINIEKIPCDPKSWLDLIRKKLDHGGCLAVICNTVDRAQEVFNVIKESKIVNKEDLYLLHSRMPFCWRKAREDDILKKFGKLSNKTDQPRHGIVVATQIIEQSLDLDFDFMITDLAPIDLLIQRIGRLHRHTNNEYPPFRPESLAEPCCLICVPDDPPVDGLPIFKKDRWVYDEVFLQRTYSVLKGRNNLLLPGESDQMINQVYCDDSLENCTELQNVKIHELFEKMKNEQDKSMIKAVNRLIGDVDLSDALGKKIDYLPEENDQTNGEMQTLTRDVILPSVHLLCSIKKDGKLLLLDGEFPFTENEPFKGEGFEHAQRSTVNVSKSEVVNHFKNTQINPAWKKTPAFCKTYNAVFTDNRISLNDGKELILDPDLGLVIK